GVGAQPLRLSGPRLGAILALVVAALLPELVSGQIPVNPPVPVNPPQVPVGPPRADTLAPPPDSIDPQDTIPPAELPRLRSGPPTGFATASWSWSRDDYMGSRDLTLLELIENEPGILPLRAGDYG